MPFATRDSGAAWYSFQPCPDTWLVQQVNSTEVRKDMSWPRGVLLMMVRGVLVLRLGETVSGSNEDVSSNAARLAERDVFDVAREQRGVLWTRRVGTGAAGRSSLMTVSSL